MGTSPNSPERKSSNAFVISVSRVHDEGSAHHDRFADRRAAVGDHHARRIGPCGRQFDDRHCGAGDGIGPGRVASPDALARDGHLTGQDREERAVSAGKQVIDAAVRLQRDQRPADRPVVQRRSGCPVDVARDDLEACAVALEDRAVRCTEVLVAVRDQLPVGGQVQPQLEDVRSLVPEGQLAVDDPMTGGHPLDVASGQRAGVAEVVAVLEHAIEDQRDRLETAVRVPLESRRGEPVLAQQQERIGADRLGRSDVDDAVVDLGVRTQVHLLVDAADGARRVLGCLHGSRLRGLVHLTALNELM